MTVRAWSSNARNSTAPATPAASSTRWPASAPIKTAASSMPRNTTRAMPNAAAPRPSPIASAMRPRRPRVSSHRRRSKYMSAPLLFDAALEPFRLQRARIGDIDRQMLGRLRGGGHQAYALGRLEAVPGALRHNDQHPGPELMRLLPVVNDDVQFCRPLDDLHQLVAVRVPLPGAVAGKLRGEDVAVAERGQRRERAARAALLFQHVGAAIAQHRQLPRFVRDIDNRDHRPLHYWSFRHWSFWGLLRDNSTRRFRPAANRRACFTEALFYGGKPCIAC